MARKLVKSLVESAVAWAGIGYGKESAFVLEEVRRGDDSLGKSNRSEFVPENSRFRREIRLKKTWAYESGDRVWIPACAGITGREGASAFAEFLTYMASLREGSRGEEVTAMEGWQWRTGDGATARIDSSLRSAPFRMTCGGCAALGRTEGASGAGSSLGMGPRIREDKGWGWVPAFCLRRGWHRCGDGGGATGG